MPGLKQFAGGAKRTILNVDIAATTTTFDVADATGYPTGGAAPFVIAIGLGTAAEEKVLVASRSGNTLTVATGGRGYDGTTAAAHNRPASVDHVLDADTLREANAFANGGAGEIFTAKAASASTVVAESTTSATYVDLATVGPDVPNVTVGPSGKALVLISAQVFNNTAGQDCLASVGVTGATTSAANDRAHLRFTSSTANQILSGASAGVISGLTPGVHTFTLRYRVTGGTGTFHHRHLTVIPL